MTFDFESYLKLSLWSEGEAICLLSSIDPIEYRELLQAKLKDLSRDPWDDFDITFSGTAYRQSEILRNQRSDRLVGMQDAIGSIKTVLNRDVMTKIITPDYIDGRTVYFAPEKFMSWAILKDYCVPTELMNFASKAEQQTEAAGSGDNGAGSHTATEPASTKVNTAPKEQELASWLREVWIKEGRPGGTTFFTKLKKYVKQNGSPIVEHYSAGKVAGIKWETSAGTTGEMKKKTILTKVSIFKRTP